MRLVYLADIRFPMERANGIQTIETCHALARAGVSVELCLRRSDGRSDADCLAFYDLEPHARLRLHRWKVPAAGSFPGKLMFAVRALSAVRREPVDAVYTRDLFLAELALRARRWLGRPVVYEAHTAASLFSAESAALYESANPPSPRKLARLKRREGRVCRHVSGLVTITAGLRDNLDELHGALAPTWVVPDGARVPDGIPSFRKASKGEPVRVTYIGQLYPWKGVDTAIAAMRELSDHELIVVGGLPPEPDLERVKALARTLGVGNRVEFRGYVPPRDLDEERRRADVFVIPLRDSATGRRFTSPLKLFEAMASGRPIVASDLPSLREVLTHEVNALLVPPDDPAALADALRRLAGDPALSERLARQAGEDVRRFSWDARGTRLREVLETVCGKSGASDERSFRRALLQ